MPSRANKFPDQPGKLPLVGADLSLRRFEPETYRAFGSIPKMLRDDTEPINFEHIDPVAWERSSAEAIQNGLFGAQAGFSVNGLALGAEYWGAIVRSQNAFESSIRGKTISANRQSNQDRRSEKELHSIEAALASKKNRHDKIISTLHDENESLDVLLDMQRTPGFHRRQADVDVRLHATTAREKIFMHMLSVLGDQYKIDKDKLAEVERALDFRLLYGSSRGRVEQWGFMLNLAKRYTSSVNSLFSLSARKIGRAQIDIAKELEAGGYSSKIRARGAQAVGVIDIQD